MQIYCNDNAVAYFPTHSTTAPLSGLASNCNLQTSLLLFLLGRPCWVTLSPLSVKLQQQIGNCVLVIQGSTVKADEK